MTPTSSAPQSRCVCDKSVSGEGVMVIRVRV